MKNILLILICCITLNAESLSYQGLKYHQDVDHSKHRGPIGIMGDHLHEKGKVMIGYYRMQMSMDHHYAGSDHISKKNILKAIHTKKGRI